MTNRNLLFALVLVGVAVCGMVLGQSMEETMEETQAETPDSDTGKWEMFSGNVVALEAAGTSSATTGTQTDAPRSAEAPNFIFNTRTGKVYRIFTGCGEDLGKNGCIEALPVVQEGQYTTVVPQPQVGGPQIRR